MSELVHVAIRDRICEITMDHPPANAINAPTAEAVGKALLDFHGDSELDVAIVTGAGERFFCAGWDLNEDPAEASALRDWGPTGWCGTEFWELNKPVIAALNGIAAGGGFEIALAADLRIAADHARMALPEPLRGMLADAGGILRLPKVLPHAVAMEMLYTGRYMEAQEALGWGVVNCVVPGSELMDKAREYAKRIQQSAPLAVRALKQVVRETQGLDVRSGYARLRRGDLEAYERHNRSEDTLEGPRAFAEKRDPVWKGR